MVRAHGHLDSEETNEAAWAATRGAVIGAARVSFIVLSILLLASAIALRFSSLLHLKVYSIYCISHFNPYLEIVH